MRNLLFVLLVVALLFAIVPAAQADAPSSEPTSMHVKQTYRPAHWSGRVHKYSPSGTFLGDKWGGGIMSCQYASSTFCMAVNVGGTYLGYWVKVTTGSTYGYVKR